jgi:hypothetical protein
MYEDTMIIDADIDVIDPDPEPTDQLPMVRDADVNMQVATAKRWPRDEAKFRNNLLTRVSDENLAPTCFYSFRRGGKLIEGPSIRVAEIAANAWGNLRSQTREAKPPDDKYVYAETAIWDLESNNAFSFQTKRKILTKDGRRFSEDMVNVTLAAATKISFRNAIISTIPRAYIEEAWNKARSIAVGTLATLQAKRTQAMDYFKRFGIPEADILTVLSRESVEQVDLADVGFLIGLRTATTEGHITLDDAFASREAEIDGETRAQRIAREIKARKSDEPDATIKVEPIIPKENVARKPKPQVETTPTQVDLQREFVAQLRKHNIHHADFEAWNGNKPIDSLTVEEVRNWQDGLNRLESGKGTMETLFPGLETMPPDDEMEVEAEVVEPEPEKKVAPPPAEMDLPTAREALVEALAGLRINLAQFEKWGEKPLERISLAKLVNILQVIDKVVAGEIEFDAAFEGLGD